MSFKYKALLIITPVVLVLDQFTKWLVERYVPFGGSIPVIEGYLDIVFLRNPGAAFGMFAGMGDDFRKIFFLAVAVVAVVLLSVFYIGLKDRARLLPVAISLIFGGIAGNIIDRIRFGEVTDFVSFHVKDAALNWTVFNWHFNVPLNWPAFNVADSAITVAMCMLVVTAFKSDRGEG